MSKLLKVHAIHSDRLRPPQAGVEFAELAGGLQHFFDGGDALAHFAESVEGERDHAFAAGQFTNRSQGRLETTASRISSSSISNS